MMHFLKKHMLLIVAAMIIAAGGFYYYRQSNVNNVEIQTTGNVNCLGQTCSYTTCSQCDSNIPVYCDPKSKTYKFWIFGQKACNQ
jgi:hypothetical protein